MSKKLTPAQVRALKELPISYTTWGDKVMSGMPKGVRRQSLWALNSCGLAHPCMFGTTWSWTITPAGLAALAQEGGQ